MAAARLAVAALLPVAARWELGGGEPLHSPHPSRPAPTPSQRLMVTTRRAASACRSYDAQGRFGERLAVLQPQTERCAPFPPRCPRGRQKGPEVTLWRSRRRRPEAMTWLGHPFSHHHYSSWSPQRSHFWRDGLPWWLPRQRDGCRLGARRLVAIRLARWRPRLRLPVWEAG